MPFAMSMALCLGLGAAFCQSLAYLLSRVYGGGTQRLLILSHVIMGGLALPVFPFVLPAQIPDFMIYMPPLLGASLTYLVAQGSLLLALKKTEASRIAPLLGLKIVFVAVIGMLFFSQELSYLKWLGVIATTTGAWIVSARGESPHRATVPLVLFACLCYSLSDLNINILVRLFTGMSQMKASFLSVTMIYIFLGALAFPIAFAKGFLEKEDLKQVMPYSLAWFAAMLFLFSCFAYGGVVFGVVVQSTRGVMSIVLGFIVARAVQKNQLEKKIGTMLLLQRIFGAVLMSIGIGLFVY
ncbi:MAG: EamA family transporter [Planctomycetes bacterium]|nr:EamA family transporter [Planctomycetota bacterium]